MFSRRERATPSEPSSQTSQRSQRVRETRCCCAFAAGLALSLALRSSGVGVGFCTVYARSHSPDDLAASTAARPLGRISPLAMCRNAIVLFTSDHLLFARRGVQRCA